MRIDNIQKQNFGSRKIPRYLYHITDTRSLAKIKECGKIKKSNFTLDFETPAVFLFELKNLTKRWGKNKKWNNNNLAEDLLMQCSHFSPNLILLKVPVTKLEKENLRIRCLGALFCDSKNTPHITKGAPAEKSKIYKARKEAIEYLYTQEIDFNNVEVLGCANNFISILRDKKLKGVLTEFFKGQPEEKCINLLK